MCSFFQRFMRFCAVFSTNCDCSLKLLSLCVTQSHVLDLHPFNAEPHFLFVYADLILDSIPDLAGTKAGGG
jgi:hypothetical protein